jgi:hypothetical protein
MNMYRTKDYLPEITQNETWKKCFSPANLNTLLDLLIDKQWLPSQITINRALTQLQFARTDGGSVRKDAADVRRKAQAQFDAACSSADALPLTPEELTEFASLSFADLQRKYWDKDGDFFRVRYNKAAKTFGYKIPPRPQVAEEIDESQEIKLTAAEYHKIPADELRRRLRNPSFKQQLYLLLKSGSIVLFLVLGLLRGGLI